MTKTVGTIGLDMVLHSAKFTQQLHEVRQQTDSVAAKLEGSFKKLGAAIAAAFSVAMIKKFGQQAIENAAGVQAANSQLTQTFGELEGSARTAMQAVAKESGILETRLQGVGTGIYAFAKASGMKSAEALNMMKEALQVTADSAAYYDRSLEDTAESLKSFLKGNYANDAALGISCTETTRNAAANKLYGQSFKDLSEAQKQLVLLQMVKDANALSGALGQAARESDGWENVIGNLKEAWKQLLAVIGKPILQGAIGVVKKLTEWISRLTEWAKAAVQALGELFGWSNDGSTQTAADAAQTATSISDSVDNQNELTKAVKKTNAAVKKTNAEVKRGIASFDKLNVISKSENSASDSASDSGNNTTDVPDSVLGNSKITAKVDVNTSDAKKKIDELKKKLLEIFSRVYTASGTKAFVDKWKESFRLIDTAYINSKFQNIGKRISEIATETAPGIVKMSDAFGGLAGSIAGVATVISGKTVEFVAGGISGWLDKDKDYIIETSNEITDNMSVGFGNLQPIFDDLRVKAALFFDVIKPFMENLLSNTLSGITHAFGEAGKWLSKEFRNKTLLIQKAYFFLTDEFPKAVNTKLSQVRDWFLGAFRKINTGFHMVFDPWIEIFNRAKSIVEHKIIQPVEKKFSQMWGSLKGGASQAWEGIKKPFSGVAEWFKNTFSGAWEKVRNIFSKGGEIFTGIKDGMYNTFKTVVNGLIDGINEVISKTFSGLNYALQKIHDTNILGVKPFSWINPIDVPVIPKLAKGGIVKAPTLAMVGEYAGAGSNPEVIAPLNKLQGLLNNSAGQDTVILKEMLNYLKRIYEMFIIFRNEGGNLYEFVAQLNGSDIFREVIRQNQLYKNRHGGKSAL